MHLDYKAILLACAVKEMSVSAILKAAHMSRQTMLNIKNEKQVLPVTAGKLAKALGVPVAELLK